MQSENKARMHEEKKKKIPSYTIDELKVSLEEAHSQMNEHDPVAETPQLEVSLKTNEEE